MLTKDQSPGKGTAHFDIFSEKQTQFGKYFQDTLTSLKQYTTIL